VGQTYAEEEEYLRSWIDERLEWINGQWGGACIPASEHSGALIGHENSLRVYPNPSDLSHTFFSINPGRPGTLTIRLYDITGKPVHHHTVSYSGSEAAWSLPDLSYLPAGIYTLEVTDREKVREICRVIRQ
jgi:hypothetical protein